ARGARALRRRGRYPSFRVRDRRSPLVLAGFRAAALVGVALLVVPGSPAHKKATLGLDLQGGLEVVLKAVPPKGHKLTSEDLDRSVSIMRNRIDKLGVSEPEIRKQGSDQIVIQLAGVKDPAVAAKLIGKTAVLQFYNFEADLTGPSVNGLQNQPIAIGSLYDLLSTPATAALAAKGTPEQWYLFDNKKVPRAGPKPTKEALLQTRLVQKTLGGHIPKTWHLLRVPHNTAVVSCDITSGNCLGAPAGGSSNTVFYLLKHPDVRDYPKNPIPEMTGSDLKLSGTRADFDQNGQPIVTMQFTGHGKSAFHTITKREAERGSLLGSGKCDQASINQFAQHFAIVLDNQISTAPYIDYCKNPDGIPGDNGAEIQLGQNGSIGEAKRIALVLQTGALPVSFQTAERTDVSATLG